LVERQAWLKGGGGVGGSGVAVGVHATYRILNRILLALEKSKTMF